MRIPMDSNLGRLGHVTTAVPVSGITKDFGMSRAKAAGQLANDLYEGGMDLAGAIRTFQEKSTDMDNRLAAAEARNLWATKNGKLDADMASHPADWQKFPQWQQEYDAQYADEVQQYTDRMSPDFRSLFEAEMRGVRSKTMLRRIAIRNQAQATAIYKRTESLLKTAAEQGNRQEFGRILEETEGTVLTNNQAKQWRERFDYLEEFQEVKNLVNKDTPGMVRSLTDRDAQGTYVNYDRLKMEDREKLARVAETRMAQARAEESRALLERLDAGELVSAEDIEREYEGVTEPELLARKRDKLAIVRAYDAKTQKLRMAEDTARWNAYRRDVGNRLELGEKISDEEIERVTAGNDARRRELMAMIKGDQEDQERTRKAEERARKAEEREKDRAERARRTAAEKQAQEKARKFKDNYEFSLLTTAVANSPDARAEQRARLENDIYVTFAGDGPTVKRMLAQVDAVFRSEEEPAESYKRSQPYLVGKQYLDSLDADDFWTMHSDYAGQAPRAWMPLDEVDDNDDAREINRKMSYVWFDRWMRDHPKATEGETREAIDGFMKDLHRQDCKKMSQFWARSLNQQTPGLRVKVLRTEDNPQTVIRTTKDGRRILFDARTKRAIREIK